MPRAFFRALLAAAVLCLSGCASLGEGSFDGLWSKRERAQLASDFAASLEGQPGSVSVAESFFQRHGKKPVMAVGYISESGGLEVDARSFASFVESELRRSGQFAVETDSSVEFSGEADAYAWALSRDVDFLVTGSVRTELEVLPGVRPLRRYAVSLAVVDMATGEPASLWTDRHLAKDVRRTVRATGD